MSFFVESKFMRFMGTEFSKSKKDFNGVALAKALSSRMHWRYYLFPRLAIIVFFYHLLYIRSQYHNLWRCDSSMGELRSF